MLIHMTTCCVPLTHLSAYLHTIFQQVVEPSSAAGVAAALSPRMKNMGPELKKIGIILCGGNVDIDKLPWT